MIFDDYLAIKYIRNTIVHGKWKDYEKEWVTSRGFPTDSRELTIANWGRIQDVNRAMMLYIALTTYVSPGSAKPTGLINLEACSASDDPHLGIISKRDVEFIFWNNLERIHAVFGTAIREASILPEYDWTGGQAREELQALPSKELMRRMYLAARRAGVANCKTLLDHRKLADTALEFWRDYYQRISERTGLTSEIVSESLAVFDRDDFDPTKPHWQLLQAVNPHSATELMSKIWPGASKQNIEATVSAFRFGRVAYDAFRNLVPIDLLGIQLPIVDPARTTTYALEFDRAHSAIRLGRIWYHCIEHQARFQSENLDLCKELLAAFALH